MRTLLILLPYLWVGGALGLATGLLRSHPEEHPFGVLIVGLLWPIYAIVLVAALSYASLAIMFITLKHLVLWPYHAGRRWLGV